MESDKPTTIVEVLKQTMNFQLKLDEHSLNNSYLVFMYCFLLFAICCVYNLMYKSNGSDFVVLYLFCVLVHVFLFHILMEFKFKKNKSFIILTGICYIAAILYMLKIYNEKKEKYDKLSLTLRKKGNTNQSNLIDDNEELAGFNL